MPFTNEEKLAEIRREIGMRQSVYGRQVAASRMTQQYADRGISIMQEIAADYEAKAAGERLL
jgi:hypothetical protein